MVEPERPATELTVLLFGTLKDTAGTERLSIGVSKAADLTVADLTVADLISLCGTQYPLLAPWLPYIRVAVNREYADAQQAIEVGDEIAFLPPVSGG